LRHEDEIPRAIINGTYECRKCRAIREAAAIIQSIPGDEVLTVLRLPEAAVA
jgi:hypothetical protein